MNHCEHCDAKQGDFKTAEKYDSVAFYVNHHIRDDFTPYHGQRLSLALCASRHSGAGVIVISDPPSTTAHSSVSNR